MQSEEAQAEHRRLPPRPTGSALSAGGLLDRGGHFCFSEGSVSFAGWHSLGHGPPMNLLQYSLLVRILFLPLKKKKSE